MTATLRGEIQPGADADDDIGPSALVGLLVVLIPVAAGWVLWTPVFAPDVQADANRWVSTSPADVASVALLVVWCRRTLGNGRTPRPSSPLAWAVAAVLGLELLALLAHPSLRGVDLLVRVAAAGATADLIRRTRSRTGERIIFAALVLVGSAQALLAMAQSRAGRPFGLEPLDYEGELWQFGSSSAGRGGFAHPYHLTCLLAVAVGAAIAGLHRGGRRWPWLLGLSLCAAGLAVTFSRTGLLGLVAVLAATGIVWLRDRNRVHLLVAVAMVAGLALGGLAFGTGWVSKSSASVDRQAVDSGRRDRAAEAGRLIRSEPFVGVGPGRYVLALEDVEHVELRPAHNLSLHVAAEAGIAAGLAATAALALLALRAWRNGVVALSMFLPLLPFLLLDAFPYTWPAGIALSGVWLGLVLRGPDHRRASAPEDERVQPGDTDLAAVL